MARVEGPREDPGPRTNEPLGFGARPRGRGAVGDDQLQTDAPEAGNAARRVHRVHRQLNAEPAGDADVGQWPTDRMDRAHADRAGLCAKRPWHGGQREPTGDPRKGLAPRHE
jgi:hypothetical protein